MARLFPLRSETPTREGAPRVVDLDGEDADAVFGALSSNTARRIYARLEEEPGTPSDLADAIDSSIQNVRYHLEKLEDAGLIEVVDTWYSSRGNEMSVYATADGPLIVTSDTSRAAQLKEALSRFVGGVGVLAVASLLVQAIAQRFGAVGVPGDDAAGGGATGDESTGDGATGDDESAAADADEYGGSDGGDEDGLSAQGQEEEEMDAADGPDVESDDGPADDSGTTDDTGTSRDGTTTDDGTSPESGEDSTEALDAFTDAVLDTMDGFVSWLSPGLAFFLGGLAVLSVLVVWWYWTSYRPMEN